MYRVLIVDDEPHVLDALQSLLEDQNRFAVDVYRAENGSSALEILEQGNIDLLISDVQMPEINGLKLLEYAHHLRPYCKVIFLTAYQSFDYAYQGLRNGLVNYVLKTEDDESILNVIEETLNSPGNIDEYSTQINKAVFSEDKPLWLICFHAAKEDTLRRSLFPYVNAMCSGFLFEAGDNDYSFIYLQFDEQYLPQFCSMKAWVTSMLEDVDHRLPEPIKIVCLYVEKLPIDFDELKITAASCLNRIIIKPQRNVYVLTANEAQTEPTQLVPMHNTVSFILKYIADNIDSDITLLKLSSITGYNADYLSDIFSRVTGESFKNYLNRCKTERIKQLMRNESLTLDEIASMVSFCTRSYFNRFIKRETGLTPKQLRHKIIEGQ